ncbi:unnamed protein product [Allacma fusca]|uniref:Rab3 GTPase-activating protein catalytic subunit n=1 Tax=Allacma fusca TaxID=39272 RepID=A0A8J2JDL9_9HEXA|nr:unnamed protein product [Allacma fusca]
MELSEEEQFEDFTTASDWEHFTAHLERLLIEWQTRPIEQENLVEQWAVLHEKVSFSDFPFKFSYFKKIEPSKPDLMTTSINPSSSIDSIPPYLMSAVSKENDAFPPKFSPHKVADYFDVKEFAVLSSAGLEPMQNESKLKALLSSACMALNNTNSVFPIFIQYHHWNQQYYCGIAEYAGTRTSFQMVHLKNVANQHKYLSGLLSIFKSKMNPTLSASVGVTAHFFYKMQTWHSKFNFDSFPPEIFDEMNPKPGDETSKPNSWSRCHAFTSFLPFGSLDDPFQELELVAGWPYLPEDVVVDSPSYSDLEPTNAPEWYFSLRPHTQAEFRLHDLADGVWNLKAENRTIEEILGKKLDNSGDLQYISALERLALVNSPLPQLNRVISNVNRAQKQLLFSPAQYQDLAPLSQEQLDMVLPFLFPDAASDPPYPYPSAFDRLPEFEKEQIASLVDGLQGIKSAPMGSLVWRLAVVLSYLNTYVGFAGAVAHLWAELVLELRYRWENSIEIPGKPSLQLCNVSGLMEPILFQVFYYRKITH